MGQNKNVLGLKGDRSLGGHDKMGLKKKSTKRSTVNGPTWQNQVAILDSSGSSAMTSSGPMNASNHRLDSIPEIQRPRFALFIPCK